MYWATLCAALFAPAVLGSFVQERGLHIVKTTTLPDGQVIDWIKRESQGEIASPPSFAPVHESTKLVNMKTFADHEVGPEGTVPILRSSGVKFPMKQAPPNGPTRRDRIQKRQYADQHWYSSTAQTKDNIGSSASVSLFKAYVQRSGDFSLLQTAVIRSGVPGLPNRGYQTLESGWINYPDQVKQPHLFTFYTTNSYTSEGNGISCWNTECTGWVQVDNQYYPGMPLSPLSVIGGAQHDVQIQYSLNNGSWWLGVNGVWAGYYPAKLFTKGSSNPRDTLESRSNQVNWYGEIYQTEGPYTTTDMGSGRFAEDGKGYAAYIRNIVSTDVNGNKFDYDGSSGASVSDPKRYTLDTHFKSGEAWGSYFWAGGPGAGGVTGG